MKRIILLLILLLSFVKAGLITPPFPNYGDIMGSPENNTALQPKNNIIELKKGWKLYGYDNGIKDINKTFGSLKDTVNIIWYFNNKESRWYAYSPDEKIIKAIKSSDIKKVLTTIPFYSGFWILCSADKNVTLNPDYNIPQEIIIGNVNNDNNFTNTSGELEIYATTLDIDGKLISDNISKSNFRFENIALYDLNNTKIEDVNMSVKDIYVHQIVTNNTIGNYVALTIDSSGSMIDNDPDGLRVEAAIKLINLISNNTYMAILTFGDGISDGFKASKLLQNFTDNQISLINALDGVNTNGGTPLYDSIIDTINFLENVSYQVNKSVIVFTDGDDTDSYNSPQNVINLANQYGINIYSIGLGKGVNENVLKEIANKTGGLYKFAKNAGELDDVFTKIGATSVKGYIDVFGLATYKNIKIGEYTIKGDLIFEILGKTVRNSFESNINIQ